MEDGGIRIGQFHDGVLAHDGGVGLEEGVEGFLGRMFRLDVVARQAEQLAWTRHRRSQADRRQGSSGLALRGLGDAGAVGIPADDDRLQLRLGTGCTDIRHGARHIHNRIVLDYAQGVIVVECQFHESLQSADGVLKESTILK